MAAPVGPLPQLKLPSGPSPLTAEQRYWRTFKNQLLVPSATGYAATHLSCAGDVFAVTTGTRVQLYSSRTRKLVKTITRFGDVARSGDLRRDAKVLVAGDDGGRIQVFDTASRAILRTWTQHGGLPVWTTRWSPTTPTTLLSAGDDKTVRLWDLPSAEPTATLAGHDDYVRCARFMPGSTADVVVSGSYDATVRLWDARVGRAAVMTFGHAAPVEDVLPLPSGTTLLAAAGSAVSVLDVVAARPRHVMANHQKTVTSLSLASGGRRLLTGGLEGHVKVFETTGWNVVHSSKYQSPVLSVLVVPSPSSSSSSSPSSTDAPDRHVAVAMQSGVLSVRTRLTGPEAARDREREREMAALVGGNVAALDAARSRRKRRLDAAARLDMVGEDPDVVIAHEPRDARRRERPWHKDLRHARYARALDRVVDRADAHYSPLDCLSLLLSLRHRGAVRDALEARDEQTVLPIVRWVCGHVCDPRYVGVCVEVALHLLDLYAEYAAASPELHDGFRNLHRHVRREVESAQMALQTGGMLDSLAIGAAP